MAFSRTLAASASPTATPTDLAAYNQAAGNCIIVCTITYNAYATGVTDTATNTYLPVYASNGYKGSGTMYCQFWKVVNCKGNAANVVRITYNATPSYSFAAYYDVSEADTVSPVDLIVPGSLVVSYLNAISGLITNFADELLIMAYGGNTGNDFGYSAGSLETFSPYVSDLLTEGTIPAGFTALAGTWASDATEGAYATALDAGNHYAVLVDNTQTWGSNSDQTVEGIFSAATGSSYSSSIAVGVRLSATSGYFLTYGGNYAVLYKYVAGGAPYRPGSQPYFAYYYVQGSKIRLGISGNTLSFYEGDTLAIPPWTDVGTGADAPITSGSPGLVSTVIGSATAETIKNWNVRGNTVSSHTLNIDAAGGNPSGEHDVQSIILTSKLDVSSYLTAAYSWGTGVTTRIGITIKKQQTSGVPNSLMLMGCGT